MARYKKKFGRLIIISAPSGAGKTTVVEALLAASPELKRSVSYTTRSPRGGEKKGIDYHFISKEEFLRRRKHGFFLEWAKVFSQFYGTSKAACLDWMARGSSVVLTIDVQGMRKLKKKLSGKVPLVTIFLMPPSMAVLKDRLFNRKTDRPAEIQRRLRIAEGEIQARREYDYVVVNRRVNDSVRRLKRILKSVVNKTR